MNPTYDPFPTAVARLRDGLPTLAQDGKLAAIEAARDEVIARFGRSFAPENLAALTADEYHAFLRFDTNQHWSAINRYSTRTTRDMDALRRALATLLDEGRPLAERYDAATGGIVEGLGRAVATPILHVVYPERYGVWNGKSEAGLRALGLYPALGRGATAGQQYAAVNEILVGLAAELGVHLWTLDTLWEWLGRQEQLAAPFDAIFADRAQAEWAFDLFAETVRRLEEWTRPDSPRDPAEFYRLPEDLVGEKTWSVWLADVYGDDLRPIQRFSWEKADLEVATGRAHFRRYRDPAEPLVRSGHGLAYERIGGQWVITEHAPDAEVLLHAIYRDDVKNAADPAARERELVAAYREKFFNPYRAADLGQIDEVIEPRETRPHLIRSFEVLQTKVQGGLPKKHGLFPV